MKNKIKTIFLLLVVIMSVLFIGCSKNTNEKIGRASCRERVS